MMQSNEYSSAYDDYIDYQQQNVVVGHDEVDNAGMLIMEGSSGQAATSSVQLMGDSLVGVENGNAATIDFNDPKIASLPRILLMGPRRGGKTSIQVCVWVQTRFKRGLSGRNTSYFCWCSHFFLVLLVHCHSLTRRRNSLDTSRFQYSLTNFYYFIKLHKLWSIRNKRRRNSTQRNN